MKKPSAGRRTASHDCSKARAVRAMSMNCSPRSTRWPRPLTSARNRYSARCTSMRRPLHRPSEQEPEMSSTIVRRLAPADAAVYRALMLEAYERHPDAFTSSADERAALPMSWWESRLDVSPQAGQVVLGAFDGDRLVGAAGLQFEPRGKARHK